MSQKAKILECLSRGWKSPIDALHEAGTMKLATRVGELRHQGYKINDIWHESGKYKLYKLEQLV